MELFTHVVCPFPFLIYVHLIGERRGCFVFFWGEGEGGLKDAENEVKKKTLKQQKVVEVIIRSSH